MRRLRMTAPVVRALARTIVACPRLGNTSVGSKQVASAVSTDPGLTPVLSAADVYRISHPGGRSTYGGDGQAATPTRASGTIRPG